jgi:apolipoprotein N-acyltransferase
METLRNDGTDNNQRSPHGDKPIGFWDRLKSIPADRLAWLWLVVGAILLPFTFFQTVIPLAAWLAPIFLLRFARTSQRARVALLLVFLAYAAGTMTALRGSDTTNLELFILGMILPPLIRGVMYTLPYAADRLIGARLASWARLFVFPLAFTTVDWLMSLSRATNSTGGSPAYSQYDNLALMQILSITGMWGVTFLIMWCASTVNVLWEHHFDWRPALGKLGVFAGVLLAVLLFGSIRLNFFAPSSQTVEAATITLDNAVSSEASSLIDAQFNQSTDAERAAIRPKLEATVDQLLARTETALRGGARIVGWQEGSATVLEEDEQPTLDRVAALARQYDAYIQVSIGLLTRTPSQYFVRNQSILVDPTGTLLWTYDKTYPVFPTESYYTIPGPGKLPVADTSYGRLSTAICNDLHFPQLIRQAGQQDADILIAPYHDLHPYESEDAVVATYRAIENGFSLVRPTGYGVSTIIDYEGRVLGSQNFYTTTDGVMLSSVPTRGVRTIYSRIGDLFAYLCVAGLVVLAAWAIVRRQQSVATVQHE